MQQITNLSITILKVHPQNQEFFDDIEGDQYEKFKNSILEDGLITPLTVSPDMTIISGHQRYKACLDIGMDLIPVIIQESLISEDEKLKKLLASNFGRLKNNPLKQGRVLSEYEKLCGVYHGNHQKPQNAVSQEDIAKELGVSVDTIQRLKKLQQLSPELQQLIEDGTVKYTTALNIYGKLSQEDQQKLITDFGADYISSLTQKKAQELISGIKQEKESLEDQLRQALNANEVNKTTQDEVNTLELQLSSKEFEKRNLEVELSKLRDQKVETIYKDKEIDKPETLAKIQVLESKLEEVSSYVQKYRDALSEIQEKNAIINKFMGESTNFELISSTSEITLKMLNFIQEMSKYDYLAGVFNEIPDATRREYMRSVYGVYKWARNIMNEVKIDDVVGVNARNIEEINYVEIM